MVRKNALVAKTESAGLAEKVSLMKVNKRHLCE